MIAHRLSTLEACDIRLEVSDGTVRRLEPDPSVAPAHGVVLVASSGR
jgi:hypothetical protein